MRPMKCSCMKSGARCLTETRIGASAGLEWAARGEARASGVRLLGSMEQRAGGKECQPHFDPAPFAGGPMPNLTGNLKLVPMNPS